MELPEKVSDEPNQPEPERLTDDDKVSTKSWANRSEMSSDSATYSAASSENSSESSGSSGGSEAKRKASSDVPRRSWKSLSSVITPSAIDQLFQKNMPPPVHALEDLDDAAIINKINEMQRSLRHIKTENDIFRRFLENTFPESLEGMDKSLAQAKRMTDIASISARRASVFSKPTSRMPSIFSVPNVVIAAIQKSERDPPKINATQKSDLLLRELEAIQAKMEEMKRKWHATKSKLLAKIEEMDTRKEELEGSTRDFEQFKQTNEQMSLAKFVRFMEEWSKKSRLMADKIRLRFSSLKVQYQKLSALLAQKQLIGENLNEIDFEQLKIENLHLVEKIEKQALLLIELKKMTGAGNLKLSQHKKLLQERIKGKEAILETILLIEKSITKSDEELMLLNPELEEVKVEYYKIKQRVQKYEAPPVVAYAQKKAQVQNLRKELKMVMRRKAIKELSLTIEIREMKRLLGCKRSHPCWFVKY